MASSDYVTVCYKTLADLSLNIDVYPPTSIVETSASPGTQSKELTPISPSVNNNGPLKSDPKSFPVVLYFHGGGLTVGNRQSWFPVWLQSHSACFLNVESAPDELIKGRVLAAGYAFISADYRLIPPATGHTIVEDLQDLFSFLFRAEFPVMKEDNGHRFKIDMDAIAVSGSSAGGLCACLCAIHCSPKPRAVLSLYGMGGNFFTPHYLRPKYEVFFRGRELLDPVDFPEYVYPFASGHPKEIADSPLSYHPATYRIPGYPANPRMLLARLYLQLGTFLDYYTGEHEPSLSSVLRDMAEAHDSVTQGSNAVDVFTQKMKAVIPERHLSLFPQLSVTSTWPPTMLLHGSADTAVPVQESQNLREQLVAEGVPAELLVFEGKEHSFDYEPGAEELHSEDFDKVMGFLEVSLRPRTTEDRC